MLCLECNSLINKDITYRNIFKTNYNKICNTCFSNNTFIQKLNVFPTEGGIIENHILFEKQINPLAIMNFLRPYYIYYLRAKKNFIVLFFDTPNQILYNILQQLSLGDIFLLTIYNNNTKENDYNV